MDRYISRVCVYVLWCNQIFYFIFLHLIFHGGIFFSVTCLDHGKRSPLTESSQRVWLAQPDGLTPNLTKAPATPW